jgi:hypothetical protein
MTMCWDGIKSVCGVLTTRLELLSAALWPPATPGGVFGLDSPPLRNLILLYIDVLLPSRPWHPWITYQLDFSEVSRTTEAANEKLGFVPTSAIAWSQVPFFPTPSHLPAPNASARSVRARGVAVSLDRGEGS